MLYTYYRRHNTKRANIIDKGKIVIVWLLVVWNTYIFLNDIIINVNFKCFNKYLSE